MNPTIPIVVVVLILGTVAWIVLSKVRAEGRRRHLSESIANNMPSGILTVDARGIITAHNPSSSEFLGMTWGPAVDCRTL